MILIFTGCDLLWFDLISYDTQKYVIYQHGRPMCTLIKLWWNVHVHSFHKFSRNPRWFLSFIQSKHWKYYSCHWVFLLGHGWVGIFSFVSSSSILVTTDNQFWVRQKQNPISYFPAPIAFQTLQTCLWSYIQTWKRLTRIFARFWNETEIFINSIFCNKTYRALHLVVCTLRMEISSRNANSLRAFLERN